MINNFTKIKMYEFMITKIKKENTLIDSSINDDSFLCELLETQNQKNALINYTQPNQNIFTFVRNYELKKSTTLEISQIKKNQNQLKQNTNSNLSFNANDPYILLMDENCSIPNNEQKNIISSSNQHYQNKQKLISQKNEILIASNFQNTNIQKNQQQKITNSTSNITEILETQKYSFQQNQQKRLQQIKLKKQDQYQNNKIKQHQNKMIKQDQNKKKKHQILQKQKQKLQKLKHQNLKFLQIKKQKDKKIILFQNQLKDLKTVKQKELVKSQQKIHLQQIEEHRKKQKIFYEAMMQEKQMIDKKISQRENQMRKKQIQEEQNRKKKEKKKEPLKSTLQHLRRNDEEKIKINELRDFLKRRNSYQQKLKSFELELMKQKPKPVKEKSELQLKSQERRLKLKSLSAMEIYRMGQQFMQGAHLSIGSQSIQKSKISFDKFAQQMRESSRTDYKDYLKESKLRRNQFSQSTDKLRSKHQIKELKNLILKEPNSSDKLLKAKLLSDKLDQKVANKLNTRLKVDSIALKLKIIEEFV